MKIQQRFFWLDVVRGLSALAVCSGHLRAMLFVGYSELQSTSLLHKLFYILTGLGHQAVMVFFVLSGFFVGGSVLKKRNNFRWIDYGIARLSRLWIVLIPVLLVTFCIDQVTLRLAPDALTGYYHSIWNSGPSLERPYSNSLLTLVGNIFFLQTFLTPIFGTNGPLWSLANEFWYYILFPLCAYATGNCYHSKKPHLILRISAAIAAFSIFTFLPPGIQGGYFIWLLGVVIYITFERLSSITFPLLVFGSTIFSGAIVYSKSAALQGMLNVPSDLVVGLSFSVLCIAMVNLPAPSTINLLVVKLVRGISEFSYSFYLSHFPFIVLVGALFYGSNQLLPNLQGALHYITWFTVLLSIGVSFWWLFEKRTNKLRGLLVKYLA